MSNGFNPLQSLMEGFRAGEEIRQAPQRQQLADLILQQQQLGLTKQQQALKQTQMQAEREDAQLDQAKAIQRSRILNQSARAMKQIPLANRQQVFTQMLPRLEQFGIELGDQQPDLSDAGLDVYIAQTQGFISDPQGAMTEFQRRSLDLRTKQLSQPTANERDLATYQRLQKESPKDAEAFGRSTGLLPKAEKLSSTAEKALINAQDDYFKGTKDAREYNILANDFERMQSELPAGTSLTFQEFLKRATGSQDEATELRRRFNAVRLSEALVNLPPGAATDRDVEEAFKGVPPENAGTDQVIRFLRGTAKLKALDNEFNLFRADYISTHNNTKGLLKAWQGRMSSGEVDALELFEPQQQQATQQPVSLPGGVKFLGFE